MKKIIITILLVFIVTGCSGGFEVIKSVSLADQDIVTYSTPDMQVKSEYKSQTFFTYLNFGCFKNKQDKTFSLSSSYISQSAWPFLETIKLVIDGMEKEFSPDRPPMRVIEGVQGPTETITVQVPEDVIRDLYESIESRMIVKAIDFEYSVYWTDQMKKNLFEFHKATQ